MNGMIESDRTDGDQDAGRETNSSEGGYVHGPGGQADELQGKASLSFNVTAHRFLRGFLQRL
ncbi:uncharacterized protein N7515_007248 [Penicillium bovifimosum]|uniref:Uncharacterized protein n=1 Tax=Penicillium bovifimosum TaxID=126998 RepID=A0A9W9L1I3_9EURO|nr:uncharacterized protein N7515_007248 [Penicillium bovifimosum]KAJ5131209.1 hypothetical protein N7515_007248 [Penicillium bovifimosum]